MVLMEMKMYENNFFPWFRAFLVPTSSIYQFMMNGAQSLSKNFNELIYCAPNQKPLSGIPEVHSAESRHHLQFCYVCTEATKKLVWKIAVKS